MPTPLETAQARLDLYIQAEASVLTGGQEGRIGGRQWKKADLPEIGAAIKRLQAEVDNLKSEASGQSRLFTGVPR
jgi:hypothetical protein